MSHQPSPDVRPPAETGSNPRSAAAGSLRSHLAPSDWLVSEQGFDPERANVYETLFTVGNGYQATRGSFEEGHAGELSGSYIAGIYDTHDSPVIDLVNTPAWLPVSIWIDGVRLDADGCEVVEHERHLDLSQGLLYRRTVFKDDAGRRTAVESLRFCSFADQHLCGIRLRVTPLDHEALVTVTSSIDGNRRNLDRRPVYEKSYIFHPETKWQKWAKSIHLQTVRTAAEDGITTLESRTLNSDHLLSYAASIDVSGSIAQRRTCRSRDRVDEIIDVRVKQGETVTIDKLATVFTSRDAPAADLAGNTRARLIEHRRQGFDAALADNASAWARKWDACDLAISGAPELTTAARFNIYHLLITASEHDPRVNIGAKSMSGEGYRGHVFWDTEIFMLPFFIYTQPATAKALLLYRYHSLGGAIANATSNGFAGAQYPWEAADSEGVEVTPKWTPDGLVRIWTGEEEIHVSADVAYGIITYVEATDDTAFLRDYGAEILFQTSRFWQSRLEWVTSAGRYELTRVIGPDEFHEHIDNNAFTNRMVQWHLHKAAEVFQALKSNEPQALAELCARLALTEAEVEAWREAADHIHIPYDPSGQLIEQFQGYFALKDVPITQWDDNDMPVYPEGLDHFTCNDTMLVKQPDVVMLLHVLPDEFSEEVKRANYEFYEKRTMHKSSLSPAIHTIFGIGVGHKDKALQYLERSAFVDLKNNQGNTQDGIHAASTAGTWQALVFGFGGFRVRNQRMSFRPWLPDHWSGMRFKIQWKGREVSVAVTHSHVSLLLSGDGSPEPVTVFDQSHALQPGVALDIAYVQ